MTYIGYVRRSSPHPHLSPLNSRLLALSLFSLLFVRHSVALLQNVITDNMLPRSLVVHSVLSRRGSMLGSGERVGRGSCSFLGIDISRVGTRLVLCTLE